MPPRLFQEAHLPAPVRLLEVFERARAGTRETGSSETSSRETRAQLWMKDDSALHPRYGGNKFRKLAYLLAEADNHRTRHRNRLKTIGAAGSHHVLATALHGRALGFEVHAALVPQPRTEHAENNLRRALAAGLQVHPARTYAGAFATYLRLPGFAIPLGGTNRIGTQGYIEAARELCADIRETRLPCPTDIVVALGSGGTVAGLLAGLRQANLGAPVTIHGVAVASPAWASGALARIHAGGTGGAPVTLRVVSDQIGHGYGYETPVGRQTSEWSRDLGIATEPTYTAKALGYARMLARSGTTKDAVILYWHTLSAHEVPLPGDTASASVTPDWLWLPTKEP
jgi:D-cysteine desulfhydrase